MEKNVFEKASEVESIEEVPSEVLQEDVVEVSKSVISEGVHTSTQKMEEDDLVEIGGLSNSVRLDIQLKDEDKSKIFTIESAEVMKPRLRDNDGKPIEPKKAVNGGNSYYESKLKILYKDTTYVSNLPNVKWFMRKTPDGKKSLNAWFNTNVTAEDLSSTFVSAISKLYYHYCVFVKKPIGKVTQAEFVSGLVGRKVKLIQHKSKNPLTGQMGYRIDISEFVE